MSSPPSRYADLLGDTPAHWKLERVKNVISEVDDRTKDGAEDLLSVSEYYGVSPRREVMEEGDFVTRADSLEGYKKCQKNDLVMNIMLAWKRAYGVSLYTGIVSPAYSVFRFDVSRCKPAFYHYLFRTDIYTTIFKANSTGVIDSRLRLYPDVFLALPILIPPDDEQKGISSFLDRKTALIDDLIAKRERQIELLQEQRIALISRAVTKGLNPDVPMKDSGVEWLGKVPGHWEVKRLKYVGEAIIGLTYEPTDVVDQGAGVLVLRASNVSGGRIVLEDTVYVKKEISERLTARVDDILICSRSGSRALIGKNAKINEESAGLTFGAFMMVFRSKCNDFLFHVFNSMLFDYQSGAFMTTTINQLTVGNIYSFEVPMPPPDEQRLITVFLDRETAKIEAFVTKVQQSIEKLREYRQSLISAAVTGKIDVRNLAGRPATPEEPVHAS